MSDENKALWNRVCITNPDAVKAITGKQYQGNSPKPYWIVERLTDEFGPCGIGWGFTILDERMERLTEHEILHVARVRFWYVLDDNRGELEQIGQTKAVYAKKDGNLMVDEDAPKKSVTDALVKCASYIGFAGDIFSGRWDDSKYIESAREHYKPKPTTMPPEVVADWLAAIEAAAEDELEAIAKEALATAEKAKDREAYVTFRAAKKTRAAKDKEHDGPIPDRG